MAISNQLLDLLRACGCDDALIGDLAEQYAAGRNRAWLANEVTAAVIQQVLSTAATHKRIAAESIIAGWALLYLISLATHQLITAPLILQVLGGIRLGPWGIALANAPDLIIPPFATALLLAQLHPRNSFAMTCAFIASFVALHAGAVGWLLATTPRELNSWINLLNVPFTCGLLVSGGLVGARRAMRPV